jgi:hypothetical protein
MFVRRIIVDTVRRLWTMYAIAGGALLFLGWITSRALADGVSLGSPADVPAWTMAMAWFLAFMPATVLEAREIARLPISRREMWIARWWLAVAVPAAVVAIGLAAVVAGFQYGVGTAQFALCLIYCALWGGSFMAVSAAFPMKPASDSGWRTNARILFHIFVVMLGGAALPFSFVRYLPRDFAGIRGPMSSVLIAALGVTVASYFYYPPIRSRAGRVHWKSPAPRPAAWSGIGDGFTGIAFLCWKQTRRTATLIGIALTLGVSYWLIFERTTSAVDFFRSGYVLPFVNLPAHRFGFPIGFLIFASVSDLDLIGDLRRLRCLPLSGSEVAALLTSTGPLFAAVLWICLLGVQTLVVGAFPATLRPDLFLTVAGGIALSQTIRMMVPANGMVKAMLGGICTAPAFLAFPLAYHSLAWTPTLLIMAAGLIALALSFLINRWSIRNNNRIYKREASTLLFLPQDPR